MKKQEITFDVMVRDRFICSLTYSYCSLWPLEESDLRKFVIEQRPTLRNTPFTLAF